MNITNLGSASLTSFLAAQAKSSTGQLDPGLSALANEAGSALTNDTPFEVSAPSMANSTLDALSGIAPDEGSSKGYTLTGGGHYVIVEAVGDTSLFDPAHPDAPNAGNKALTQALDSYLAKIAQTKPGDALPGSYHESSLLVGGNGLESIAYSADFSLRRS